MHHRPIHHPHCHGRRFARGEHGPDRFDLGGGRHGRGSFGRGRFFGQGDLRLVVLRLIAEKPRHGYEIIKAIEERVGGAYSPSPGVIYPTLTMLEELGHVAATAGEGSRKQLELTAEGRAFLEANRATVEALLARMEEAGRRLGGGPAPQVARAMENLKLALRLRLGRGPLTEEAANAVAAALDAAAVAVERT
ncbi:PadR family transcriptional regulator [Dankookia rubra]|uniref:PadR family transcriptional regulator n=1 Tax=Dankookia rubra TaxID=1442381 RepID=A0A4R5QII4_9PROT|nr:PadR family transcriptional regulator [Dankookia rubra]TDH63200.1 PadR family transcriptional regulator [Dankookia rubra]